MLMLSNWLALLEPDCERHALMDSLSEADRERLSDCDREMLRLSRWLALLEPDAERQALSDSFRDAERDMLKLCERLCD